MVSKSDRLSDLFKKRAGLVEAELLPYMEIEELVIVSSLSTRIRSIFLPYSSHHINFLKVFTERLNLDPSDSGLSEITNKGSWLEVLKVVADLMPILRLMEP